MHCVHLVLSEFTKASALYQTRHLHQRHRRAKRRRSYLCFPGCRARNIHLRPESEGCSSGSKSLDESRFAPAVICTSAPRTSNKTIKPRDTGGLKRNVYGTAGFAIMGCTTSTPNSTASQRGYRAEESRRKSTTSPWEADDGSKPWRSDPSVQDSRAHGVGSALEALRKSSDDGSRNSQTSSYSDSTGNSDSLHRDMMVSGKLVILEDTAVP